MSPLALNLGVDLDIVDDAPPNTPPTATDTGFLLMPFIGTPPAAAVEILSPAQAKTLWPTEAAILTAVDAYFGVGGSRLFVAHLGAAEETSVLQFTPQMGPGQLMAPTVVAATDQVNLRDWAWNTNRVYIAQAPDGATDAALATLATALISANGRFSMLEADFLKIPGSAPGVTRDVGSSVVSGGLIARSDRITGNPNLAAAGNHTPGASGVASPYVVGIKTERSATQQTTNAQAQINHYRMVNGEVRKYGFFTLADLATLPHWWDFSGSRLAMALRAEEQAVAEELMFGQVSADGLFNDKYQGALAGVLSKYQRMGAIFGNDQTPGYSVAVGVVGGAMNPVANVQQGKVAAVIKFKSSPFAAQLTLSMTRKALTDSVAA